MDTKKRSVREKPLQRAGQAPRVTEAQFQSALVQYLRLLGFRTYHTKFSIGSDPGFPDVVAVRAGRCCFIEIKAEGGKVSPAQAAWGAALAGVGGTVEYHLLRASDAGWAFIEQTFR